MRSRAARAAILVITLAGCGSSDPAGPTNPPPASGACSVPVVSGTPTLTAMFVAERGLLDPLDLQAPPGDRARIFIVEQAGRIKIIRGTTIVDPPFLDIVSRVGSGGERGLLGLTFHPRYSETGRFYVNYTDRSGDTHISEFRVTANADRADPTSERELLFVRQPFPNHNGGGMAFGNDGMLYIGLGDGGSGGDPFGNGQNLGTPLGKMLRIDVDRGPPFGVPSDNPFVNTAGAFPAVWAYGLRNPWRFSFDRATGDLYIGDVGQGGFEEIDLGLASRRGGENYGWNIMEGSSCFRIANCNRTGLALPVLEYSHGDGVCSVIGGVVYRGCRMPAYHGTYFYGDYCAGFIRSFRLQGGAAVDRREWTAAFGRRFGNLTSFGVDGDGEVYIVDSQQGIFKIVPVG